MNKAMQFRMNIMEAFIAGIEREIRWAEGELANLNPESFKDPKIREEFMELMAELAKAKDMRDAYNAAKNMVPEAEKKKEDDGPQTIGFMKFKEAA